MKINSLDKTFELKTLTGGLIDEVHLLMTQFTDRADQDLKKAALQKIAEIETKEDVNKKTLATLQVVLSMLKLDISKSIMSDKDLHNNIFKLCIDWKKSEQEELSLEEINNLPIEEVWAISNSFLLGNQFYI